MTAVSVRNVWKIYGNQTVLERVNLEIPAHSFCAIVGASGCGKTTFLRMLLSQETPSRGEILIGGEPVAAEPGPDRGVVFQRYSVFPHLTAAQNVMLGLEFRQSRLLGKLFGAARKRALDEAHEMLDEVGLSHARDKYPSELSGGMQQRLAIAQALICKPRVLLLDEPFGALDVGTKAQMHELTLKLWRSCDMTVFMVTHDIQEGFALATRLVVFDKWRTDPQSPESYGATITYDVPLDRAQRQAIPADPAGESV